jgi:hypothetical protein
MVSFQLRRVSVWFLGVALYSRFSLCSAPGRYRHPGEWKSLIALTASEHRGIAHRQMSTLPGIRGD